MKKTRTKPAPKTQTELEAMVQRAARYLDNCLVAAERSLLRPDPDPDLIREGATVARAINAFQIEARQAAKQSAKDRRITPQEVVARVLEMEPNERAHVMAELGLIAEGKGLFG